MKTPFETLLAQRAEAMQNARCPYSPEELDDLISSAVRSGEQPVPQLRPQWLWQPLRVACMTLFCFVAAYAVVPQTSLPSSRIMVGSSLVETMGVVSAILNNK